MAELQLSTEILEAAIEGIEIQKRRMDEQIAELRNLLGAEHLATGADSKPGRRKFSPATRQKMREAQRRRWAKVRGEAGPSSGSGKAKPRRKMSAAGRKAIAEAAKKMWAARRARRAV